LICLAEEFTKALNVITPELSDDDIRRVFHAVDINGDNQITYTEFLAATMDPLELDVGAVSRAFQLMDVNNDGYITAEELDHSCNEVRNIPSTGIPLLGTSISGKWDCWCCVCVCVCVYVRVCVRIEPSSYLQRTRRRPDIIIMNCCKI
jgi:hypothetical protein